MTHVVKIAQWGEPVEVDDGLTLLEAALEQGVPYPHGCRSGNCGACKSRLYAGSVEMKPYSDFALTDEEKESGFVLACRSLPQENLEVAWLNDDEEMVAHPLRRFEAVVAERTEMTHDIVRLRLAVPEGVEFAYTAGQYASLGFAGRPGRDYSMASKPGGGVLEFHIRAMDDGEVSNFVRDEIGEGDKVAVEGPYGAAYLREAHRGPILAIAGGSGLAPVKAIVETALEKDMPQPMFLYFGVRGERDVYLEEEFARLAEAHERLRIQIVLSEPEGETGRRTGFVHDAVAADFDDLDGCKAYLAGPPVMVEAATEMLEIRDMRPEDIHADAFYTEAEKAALNG
ncbi:MAG: 2Fe-2S iron-sulfur cluster binding domain-containing protein [Alphaproteobacteria bacterium]|nr:2Fe-2S iron-sulfur cluster binding domain-containing protein [Alphaproteobacteria bacterium]